MRSSFLASLFLATGLLAGCGSSPTPAPAPTATVAADGGAAAKVAALSPQLRAGVLLRAIRDAGQDCQQVVDQTTAQVPNGPPNGPPTWVATCQDHHRWVVAIAPDGTATVVDANDVARLH